MKTLTITLTITSLALFAITAPLLAQSPSNADSALEGYPILKASEILKPSALKGPYHTVLESVPTQGFANQYTVKTSWGTFAVHGNHLLVERIHEFDAIAQLENISKSEEFQEALVAAAAKPLNTVGNTLRDPVGTVKNVGTGAGRFLRKVGEAVDRGGKKSANTDSALQTDWIFESKAANRPPVAGRSLLGQSGSAAASR
jgi:hypothetical protein